MESRLPPKKDIKLAIMVFGVNVNEIRMEWIKDKVGLVMASGWDYRSDCVAFSKRKHPLFATSSLHKQLELWYKNCASRFAKAEAFDD